MKTKIVPLLITSALIAGCQPPAGNGGSAAPTVNKADAIADVNGSFIAKSTFETLQKDLAARSRGQNFPKDKLVEELVQRELLVQEAVKKGIDKSPEIVAQLEEARKSILAQEAVQSFIKTSPVTDDEIKAEYDKKVAGDSSTEYKARHILVKTEDEAKKIIAELDKGGEFAKLANKYSLDGKEAKNGGDLGWFAAGQMVEPFSKAVIALEKGQYTKTPVQTQFGWHVILKEDSRKQTPPPLDAVKEQLTPFLQRQKVQKMIETLREQAKVEILIPLTEEPPKAPEAAKEGEKPVVEGTVEEVEVKDASGKTVEKEVIIDEKLVEEKKPAEAKAEPAEKAKETKK